MAITVAPAFTRKDYLWTDWKSVQSSKSLVYQYDDDGEVYTIYGYNGFEVHVCTIWKGIVPDIVISGGYSQSQNDTDKTDWETNFKSTANASIADMIGGLASTSAPTYTNNTINALSLTTAGALRVDNSGNTQPISGTVTANIGTSGSLALDASVNGVLLTQASSTSGQKGPIVQGATTASAPIYTTATTNPLSLTTAGALRVDNSANNQPVIGVTAQNATIGNGVPILGGAYNSTLPTITSGHNTYLQTDSRGLLLTNGNIVTTAAVTDGTTRMYLTGGEGTDNLARPFLLDVQGQQYVIGRANSINWHSNATINSNSSTIFNDMQSRDVVLHIKVGGITGTGTPTLTLTMQDVDPNEQTTTVGGSISIAITATGTYQVYFKSSSSYMKFSWAVSGSSPSFTGVYTTFISKIAADSVSLGTFNGKSIIGKTGTITSTAVTADQVVVTYTVSTGKTLYVTQVDVNAYLSTYASTATLFGTASLETPSGTKAWTQDVFHTGAANPLTLRLAEPMAILSGQVVRVVVTPAATTSYLWRANIVGYEK